MYIIPEPQLIKLREKEFVLQYDARIIVHSDLSFKETNYAYILKKDIEDNLGFSLYITKSNVSEPAGIFLTISDTIKPEHYTLSIAEDSIVITGGNSNALLYGVQTLRQIISQKGALIPCLEIEDYPEILNRGFYHDVTRGRVPKLSSLKKLADKMSYYKLNQLQVYVEHTFLFQDFSEVWRDDTPLTAEEILELDEYCTSINVELVPSIASFGHLHKLLSTKTYAELCELPDSDKAPFSFYGRMAHHTIDVSNDESFELIKKMLLEFLPLFSSKLFNICSDETFDLGKGKNKELADQVGTDRLYVDFLKKICLFIKSQGRRPMFWGDIILAKPEAIKELPEDVICLNWDYGSNVSDKNVKRLYDLGVNQYLCPGVQGWKRLINHNDSGYLNIAKMCEYAHKYKAMGVLNTDWGDYGHIQHPEFSTTGMIYGASFSWNKNQLSFDEINKQISLIEYKDMTESVVKIICDIGRQDELIWDHLVTYKEIKEKAINYHTSDMDQVFLQFHLDNALQSNASITSSIHELYEVMSHMDSSKRYVIKPYIIAAKGMMIMHQIGATIGQYIHKIDNPLTTNPKTLAVDLEYWFKDFKELWRTNSKESELHRVQNIIFYYADLLRDITI